MKTAETLQYKKAPKISDSKLNGRISIPIGNQKCPLKRNNNSDSTTNATFKRIRQYHIPYRFITCIVILLSFSLLNKQSLGLPLAHHFGDPVVLQTNTWSNQYDMNQGGHKFLGYFHNMSFH